MNRVLQLKCFALSFNLLRKAEYRHVSIYLVNRKWSHLYYEQVKDWLMTNILYQNIALTLEITFTKRGFLLFINSVGRQTAPFFNEKLLWNSYL